MILVVSALPIELVDFDVDTSIGSVIKGDCLFASVGVGKVESATRLQKILSLWSGKIDKVFVVGYCGYIIKGVQYQSIGDVIVVDYAQEYIVDVTDLPSNIPHGYLTQSCDVGIRIGVLDTARHLRSKYNVWVKSMLSDDVFLTSKNINKYLEDISKSGWWQLVDMETAAIGRVCGMNSIPFQSIKTISDYCDSNSHEIFKSQTELPKNNAVDLLKSYFDSKSIKYQ